MTTTTIIPGSINDALRILDKYPKLSSCIDRLKLTDQANKKYPNGVEINENEITDLFSALLISENQLIAQNETNAATPQGAFCNIEEAIKEFSFGSSERKKLGDKLCNLRTSSLWDTLTELLLARTILKRLPGHRVAIEFPLEIGSRKKPPKDADVAILDTNGDPILLFDAVTPKYLASAFPSYIDKVVEWISSKYDSKFDDYCKRNLNAKVAIVVCLMKNEHFYVGFLDKLLSNKSAVLPHDKLSKKIGLRFGMACSFRCADGRTLDLDLIASYSG